MDRANGEIEGSPIEGEPEGIGKSSWSSVFLRRSWWIGKRVTIAGAAITSAPVIIPPLFVLSTLGLAFSFPFGIYLAGYVCAEKIMSVLLPQPPLKEEIDKESLESEDLIETGFDAVQLDEMILDEEKWENAGIFEGERQEGVLSEFGNRNGVERRAVESGVEGEVEEVKTGDRIVEVDEMGKIVQLGNDTAAVEELRKNDFAYSAKIRGVQLGEEVRDEVTAPESSGSPKSLYTVVVMAANEESNNKGYETTNISSEYFSLVELRGEGKANDTLVTKELREDVGVEEKILRVANGAVAKDKELLVEYRTEVPRLKSDYELSVVIVPSKEEDFENFDKVGSMERRSLGRPVPAAVVEVGLTVLRSHDEISSLQGTNNEEQQWDQIFSLRAIVGYNETLQPSLWEELMVLYLFIGVEPPVNLKHATDTAEINKNLQFLKSVVGVK